MKKHNGIRKQDILILLKVASLNKADWYLKDIAYQLGISQSEASESVNRSSISGLMSADKKRVMKNIFLEFLQYGLPYVFPIRPEGISIGIPTAHSAEPLKSIIQSNEIFIWPWENGKIRGQSIEPLYHSVPKIAFEDKQMHELLALVDALRVGKTREKNYAIQELTKKIKSQ